MILARRILPFVGPLVFSVLYSGIIFRAQEWKLWVIGMFLFTLLLVGFLMEWKWKSKKFLATVFPLSAVLLGGTGLLFFLQTILLELLFAILLITLSGLYLEAVFIFYYQPQKYSPFSLPQLSFFMNAFGGFCLFSFAFALHLIGLLPMWVMTLGAFLFTTALMSQLLWSYRILEKKHVPLILCTALCITELVWILQYWPTAFFVNGLLVALLLYSIPSLIQTQIRTMLSRKVLVRYLVIGSAAVIATISTSQWT